MKLHHLNCGILHAPPNPAAACHCLLLEQSGRLVLVDAGIGLHDIAERQTRIGQERIDAAGYQFQESLTALRQIEQMGFDADQVTDIVLSHGDPDHAGGLTDFPAAVVHLSHEELTEIEGGNPRYSAAQFAHSPNLVTHANSGETWFGLEARRVSLFDGIETYLIPLFGHTLGHCGFAVQGATGWHFYVGDAYYLRIELTTDDHPVSALAAQFAVDDTLRQESIEKLRRLTRDHGNAITLHGYHDFEEFPAT